MGKKSDQLEREIAEHRHRLTLRREQIQERVKGGLEDARAGIKDEFSARTSQTKLNEYVEKRPMSTLAAAFGTGILLGAVSEGGGGGARDERYYQRYAYDRRNARGESGGGGLLSGMLGSITGPLGNTVQDELRSTIREFFGREDGASDQQQREDMRPRSMSPDSTSPRSTSEERARQPSMLEDL